MTKGNISLMDFQNNPNIGIYLFANDKFCLIGKKVEEKIKKQIEENLKVPVFYISILDSELVGIFLAGNNQILICPKIYDKEFEKLKEICKKFEVNLIQIDDIKNSYGNNICVGDDLILINSTYSKKFSTSLFKKTNYKIIEVENKKFNAIGSTSKFIKNKFFFSQEYKKEELEIILDKICGLGTINSASYFISSGIVGNKNGVIIGSLSTSVEIQNVLESFDYL